LNVYSKKITNLGLKCLGENCISLDRVRISFCDNITTRGLSSLAARCGGLRSVYFNDCKNINNKAIKYIAENLKLLESLDISGCSMLSDEALKFLSDHCALRLKRLNLNGNFLLTNDGIRRLVEKCHELLILGLGRTRIEDSTLEAIANHCQKLKILNLDSNNLITDAGVNEIAKNCKDLQCLILWAVPLLTNDALGEIAKHCRNLRSLNIGDCMSLTLVGLYLFTLNRPFSSITLEIDVSYCSQITQQCLRIMELFELQRPKNIRFKRLNFF